MAEVAEAPSRRGRTTARASLGWSAVALVAAVLAVVIAVVAISSGGDDPVEVVVPAGTGQRVDAGEVVEAVAPIIHLEPGDVLELTNDDSRLHVLGALRAEPGGSARQLFDSEGRYVVSTSLRSDGLLTILVEAPAD